MISAPDRQHAIVLIDEARNSGARLAPACAELGINRRTYRRWRRPDGTPSCDGRPDAWRPTPANKLSPAERQQVRDTLHRPEYASRPPGQVVPAVLDDEGCYIASESSCYRILREADEQHPRGRAKAPVAHPLPTTYVAEGPNEVWTWDISYLPSHVRGLFFYLYLIVDIYSRKIVAADVYPSEDSAYAAELVQRAMLAAGCVNNPPVLHSDNGAPMKGMTLRRTLDWLGIERSFSRPRVSNDNPFSEAMFRTCKYRPDYPVDGFADLETAQAWVHDFTRWYNEVHRHSALKFVTPGQRHRGEDAAILRQRHNIYQQAWANAPQRWSGATRDWSRPGPVTLNPARSGIPEQSLLEVA
jgi:transposase InsO family protein